MREITANPNLVVPLGRQGENQATIVKFPVSGWNELYGDGSFSLLHKRSGDVAPYPVTIEYENGFVIWAVTSADVYYMGYGTAQLMYIVGDAVAKSVMYKTSVLQAIDGGEIPEPTPSWIEEVLEIGEKAEENQHTAEAWAVGKRDGVDVPDTDETYHNNSKWYAGQAGEHAAAAETAQGKAEDAQEAIENLSVSAETVAAGSSASVTKTVDPETGAVNLDFEIPRGDTGYPTDAQVAEATDEWLEENVAQETGYVLDSTLTMSNAAAPADKVGELKTAIAQQSDAFDTEYVRGSVIEIQNGALGKASIDVYGGTTPTVYICGENFVNTSGEYVTGSSYSTIPAILQAYTDSGKYVKGKYINASGGLSNNANYVVYVCPAVPNRTMYFVSDDNGISGVAIVDSSGNVLKYATVGWQKYYAIDIPSDGAYAMLGYSGITLQAGLTFVFGKYSDIQKLSSPYSEAMINNGYNAIWAITSANLRVGYKSALPPELVKNVIGTKVNFTLQDGTPPNPSNAYAVGSKELIPVKTGDIFQVKCDKPLSASGNYYQLQINYYDSTQTRVAFYDLLDIDTVFNIVDKNVSYMRLGLYEFTSGGEHVTLRTTSFLDNSEVYVIQYEPSSWVLNYPELLTARKANNHEVNRKVLNAKHATSPLSILHFSDLHADTAALKRIMDDASTFTSIDDAICTGDIVSNTYASITSWWNPSVMTCIGNHDTASYSGGAYDWTALSMADRDAYYIAPFEANWGITHTAGTSYYYKDYSTQKVRLIVMDVMLYKAEDQTQATAQTAWLENLLADAITNNLHVLIAIHTAHGGATAEECSFSKYNQGAMPTYSDCNTPQSVIDTVATKITAGLHFIGYICGHTHQDNIWDAENDGKQLMYCVTCASTTSAQWANSDQHRDADNDAYNIVVIDTTNTLVKLVRGGGADIDDHMRTRKAICFNYSTGEKVGEVL